MITLISALLALVILAMFFVVGSKTTNETAFILVWILIGFSFYGIATILKTILTIIFN